MSCGRRRHRRQIFIVPHFRRAPRSAPSSRSLPPSMRTSSGPDYRCVAGACGLTSTTAAKAAAARYDRVPTQRAQRSLLPPNKSRRTWGWSSEVSSLAPRQIARSLQEHSAAVESLAAVGLLPSPLAIAPDDLLRVGRLCRGKLGHLVRGGEGHVQGRKTSRGLLVDGLELIPRSRAHGLHRHALDPRRRLCFRG